MRILYYLEPYTELGKPLFRLATVRNHLDRETQRLLENRVLAPQIGMLCSNNVAHAVRRERLLANVQLFTLTQAELRSVYPTYIEASARWYNRDFDRGSLQRMAELCRKSLGGFEPDVIICYESSAPFLEHLFPRALFLHNTLGMFSRSPYPETSALDPFGIGKDAFPRKFAARIRDTQLNDLERARLLRVKQRYQLAQLEHSPLPGVQVRAGFERVVLLPLQVSQYFMFDENCPPELQGKSQLDLVRYVLERVDPAIGVYVTMHGSEATLFTDDVLVELRTRFPNFLFSEKIQRMRWVSQHVLPHVDGVVTVSSSVGLQAMVWDLPVVTLGRSHLTVAASSESLSDLPALLHKGRTQRLDGALYYLLMHYYPLMDAYHHRGEWFGAFLERGLSEKARGFDFDFFQPIDDPDTIAEALIEGLRPGLYQQELRASLRNAAGPAISLPTEEIAQGIAHADLVSFDVFDTLVTRPLSHPRAVFDLIAPQAEQLLSHHSVDLNAFGGFRRLREEASRTASSDAQARGVEEYDLLAVYELLCARVGAKAELAPQLKQLEERMEVALSKPRAAGVRAFQRAINCGKRTILISDIFLDVSVVREILEHCGVRGYAQLYVSSEYTVLKRTGRLYERIRELEGNPARWMHVGDNRLSDVQVPFRLGLKTYLMPSISELYSENLHIREVWKADELNASIGAALQHGVISRKFYDAEDCEAHFDGSPYRLGYEAGGPLMLSFVLWLLERAQRDGVSDLYFLARDGFLPKQICDMLAPHMHGPPRSHYLYASRRAYSVASLTSTRDILHSLDGKTNTVRLGELLSWRFGADPLRIQAGSLQAAGFGSLEDSVTLGDAKQLSRLTHFLELNSDLILSNAQEERAALMTYLEAEGLFDATRKPAIVDIGHHASLQVALSKLGGRSDLRGYYFSTFYPAHQAYRSGLDMASYLLEFEETASSNHVYSRNIGMFEFLFLPALPSLKCIRRQADGTVEPVFVEGDEQKRFKLSEAMHRGALDFCADVIAASALQPWLFQVSKNDAIRSYARFILKPSSADAKLLDGVSFVDAFGGAPTRYLIATPFLDEGDPDSIPGYLKESWWNAGAQAIAKELMPQATSPAALAAQGLKVPPPQKRPNNGRASDGESTHPWERKLRKFLKDPETFARDTKVVKTVRKLLRK